jgi:dolichol-phosphate mannosyltransferase
MNSKEGINAFKINVLVPCFNEENNIKPFFDELVKYIGQYDYKVIFIDDGSTDGTMNMIKILSAINSQVFYVKLSRNFGHQIALKAGYDHSIGADCVISLDADLQQPPFIIKELINKWQLGFQIVNAVRKKNERVPFFKRCSSKLFYKIINLFSKQKITVNSPDFRLLDKQIVSVIQSLKEQNIFLREIISWAGFNQTTVEFEIQNRFSGKTKYSLRKMISLSINGIFAYGLNPLRLAIFTGLFLSISAFAYAFYAIYNYLYNANTVPGWTSMIASFMFIAGFQFILIGVIGEYLGKTYIETKRRPAYLVYENNLEDSDNHMLLG